MASHFLRRDVLCVANNTSIIYKRYGSPDPDLFHFGIKASLFAFLCLIGSHAHRECDISHGMAEVEGFPAW